MSSKGRGRDEDIQLQDVIATRIMDGSRDTGDQIMNRIKIKNTSNNATTEHTIVSDNSRSEEGQNSSEYAYSQGTAWQAGG
jgi:hypothetical protein